MSTPPQLHVAGLEDAPDAAAVVTVPHALVARMCAALDRIEAQLAMLGTPDQQAERIAVLAAKLRAANDEIARLRGEAKR